MNPVFMHASPPYLKSLSIVLFWDFGNNIFFSSERTLKYVIINPSISKMILHIEDDNRLALAPLGFKKNLYDVIGEAS